jgi:broad specificity phosphatase PhoE
LVRHAEKVDDGTKDPPLNQKGKDRAQRLANHLSETDITAIYSTPYKRTQSTVASIAKQKGIDIKQYDPFGDNTLERILEQEKGGIIVIAGHSNTTPHLVNIT